MIQTYLYTFFFGFLSIICAFIIVIGVHEWGHFLVARRLKVKVLRVNLGFGKPFWRKKSKQGFEYALSPLLLGGYVRLLDEREGNVPPELLSQSMTRQFAWKRISILFAGPLMNFIFALIFFMIVFLYGLPSVQPVIGKIIPASVAEKAGFKKGDKLLTIQEKPVNNWIWVNFYLLEAFGEKGKLNILVQHANAVEDRITVSLSSWKLNPLNPNLLSSLGIQPALSKKWRQTEKLTPLKALLTSVDYVAKYIQVNGIVVYKIIRGVLSVRSLAGPIAVFVVSAESAHRGWIYYCFFLAFLSVSVGAFNLLPIPGLDGFQILIVLIEKIRGRPVSSALQVLLYQLGLIILVLLFVQVIVNDVARYGKLLWH
jgi:regulator of sigma E protease